MVFAVVTLANNNEVAGLNIDARNAQFGIWGNGNNGIIRDNNIFNATSDGIRLAGIRGNWDFLRNNLVNNGRDGLWILDALDTASQFNFVENNVIGNGFEGIHMRNFDPASIMFLTNNTSGNLRHGLFLENYLNTATTGIRIENHLADSNFGSGVFLNGGDGNLDILNSTITNNSGTGVLVRNWTNTIPTDRILIGTTNDGTSTISGNNAFANVGFVLDIPGARSNVVVTDQILSDGVRGIGARVTGVGTVFNLSVIDNVEINRNVNDGIRLLANDSATINATILNTDSDDPLQIIDNAVGDGSGIALVAEGANGQPPATINAFINNVEISNILSTIVRPGIGDLVVPTEGVTVQSFNNALVDVTVMNSTIGVADVANGRDTQVGVNLDFANSGSQLINRVVLDNLTINSDVGVLLSTGPETYTDFYLSNSTILPNGAQSTAGVRSDNNPFTDGVGSIGVLVIAQGRGTATGSFNMDYQSNVDDGTSFFEIITDGVLDNLTRVSLVDNVIQDFTFEGVDINATGDAQMMVYAQGNQILNNGAGFDDDSNNDNVFGNSATGGIADPNNLLFWDGFSIDAFDQSTVSTRINGNLFRDNFERGLSLNTYNTATINGVVNANVFFGNDRGEDGDNTSPPVGTGNAAGFTGPVVDSGIFDFEAINNEEFKIRDYESQILISLANGNPIDLTGMNLPADTFGFFYPGNGGVDVFGNPVAFGTATMNLGMSSNSFQLDVDLEDYSVAPGDFRLGLDGATNGFTGPFFGITDVSYAFPETAVQAEEGFFGANNFPSPAH